MKNCVWFVQGLLFFGGLLGITPSDVRGQLVAGPGPKVVSEATQVVDVWRPEQHLYVKGELGVADRQLDALEQWLDENGPNWTVVLMDDTVGERYRGTDGRIWEGMDAVEQALGRGLSNRTGFGTLKDPRTEEPNGAVFALSLGDRSFSYFASDAQDRRGLGESQWQGRLDRPAYEAMSNGGRIVDAVKNTVTSINQALDQAIVGEEQTRINREREQERMRERVELLLARANKALANVEGLRDAFVRQNPTAKGDLARPPVSDWRDRLNKIQGQVDANELVPALQKAGALMDEIEGILLAYREDAAFPLRWKDLQKTLKEAPAGPNDVARQTLDQAQAALEEAQALRDNGDRQSTVKLAEVEQLLKEADARIQAENERLERIAWQRRIARNLALVVLAVLLLLVAGLLILLNRRRRGIREKALARLAERREKVRQTTDGMLGLLERTQMLIGREEDLEKRGSHGRTLELSKQTIDDVDNLFIMSRTVDSVLRRVESLIEPKSLWKRIGNLFQTQPFEDGIALLDEQTLKFSPEEGVPVLPEEKKEDSDKLLGDMQHYKAFELTYEDLLNQYERRYERAVKSLDALDRSWTSLGPTMDVVENRIDELLKLDEELQAEAQKDGYFALPSLSLELMPAVQQAHERAEQTGVGDPVTAVDVTLADAQRQSEQAVRLARFLHEFRSESLPALRDYAQTLANEGRQIDWVDDFLRQLSERAELLMRTIVSDDADQLLEEFSQQLHDLVIRARRCVELDQTTRKKTAPLLASCEKATAEARQQIGQALNLPSERILREAGADPDHHLSTARQQLVSAGASLDRGAFLPAEAAIKEVEHLVAEAQQLIERTREGLQNQPSRRADLEREAAGLTDEVGRCQTLLGELKAEFAASALETAGKAVPESETAASPPASIDADLQLIGLLQSARRRIDASERLRQEGRILEATAELDEAHATLSELARLCQQVTELAARLREQQAINSQKLNDLKLRCRQLAGEIEEQRTMARTQDAYRACLEALDDVEQRVTAHRGNADPFRTAQAMETVNRQLDEVQQSVTADRDLYAEAARSCEAAQRQVQTALSLSERAASDQLPDSDVTRQVMREIRGLADQVNQLRLRLSIPHEDWHRLDQEADQLTSRAGQANATLRGDLDRAQRSLESLQKAASQVRLASGWRGTFGINIMGSPGGDDLEMARQAFSRGDYDGASRFASNAIALASRAVQEAEMRVRERRRAEQRRRQQELQRRLPPIILPRGGGISIGPSSWPGSSGSRGSIGPTFRPSPSRSGGSPGSGFRRSGW